MGALWTVAPVAVGVLNGPPMRAQTAAIRPAFEVAATKRNTGVTSGESIHIRRGGGFEIQNMPVRGMIREAYRMSGYQVSGGPGWIDSERYDIVAKAGGDATPEEFMLMLKALLEDRFGLKAHRETREGSVYVLSVTKGGIRMQHAEGTCVPRDPKSSPAPTPPGEKPVNYCGNMRRGNQTIDGRGEPVGFVTGATPLGTLAGQLSSILDRTVLDKTGLDGIFNFHLEWAPDSATAASSDVGQGPSIFTAIQEQLGLRLESGKGPVEFLIVDQVQQPSEN